MKKTKMLSHFLKNYHFYMVYKFHKKFIESKNIILKLRNIVKIFYNF
jgi:hypothetical protein